MGLWEFVKELFRLALFAWWNKVTENYGTRPPAQLKYVVDYLQEYTRDYFQDGFTDYLWNPIDKAPRNHLYDDKERFKYLPAKEYDR